MAARARERSARLGIPFSAQVDLTWRCNERCVHCYLDHDGTGELTSAEAMRAVDELADLGVFQVTFSGGEIFLRKDLRPLVEYARSRMLSVHLKTNATMIRDDEAAWIRASGVAVVQVSLYSNRAEVHDAITELPGSWKRTVAGIRRLKKEGVRVIAAFVLMRTNAACRNGVLALCRELGAEFTIDPTITPHLNGDRSLLALNIAAADLQALLREEPAAPLPADLDSVPCSAGHTSLYVSPFGDVYPCVQFPLPCGNFRQKSLRDIWRGSARLAEVRSIRLRDLPVCSTCDHAGSCSRCPGLAYMDGDMRGPSAADCVKSQARTGTLVRIAPAA